MHRGTHRAPTKGRSRYLVVLLVVGMIVALAAPAFAGGPANKATGSGYWTNAANDTFYGEFSAHAAMDGRLAKGYLYQDRGDGSWFSVDVTEVYVGPNWACFAGNTVDAGGDYAGKVGQNRWTFVYDGGEPGIGVDLFKGSWGATSSACKGGTVSTDNDFDGGNVQIHWTDYDS